MSYPSQAPWTGIGSLQSDVSEIRSQLHGKADKYELHSIVSKLDSVERECREIRSALDGFRDRIERMETLLLARDGGE